MRRLGLAEYGGDELLIALIACGLAAAALARLHPLLAIIPLVPLAIVVWFFRDPERSNNCADEIMLSPADGTVSDIGEVEEPKFIGGRAIRIGIFLSPFNVHVNRSPCAGTVRSVEYLKGEFLPAYNPKAPERNESTALGLELANGLRVVVKQITGILARRIICEVETGEGLSRGQRYGMIKFGSRTELYVPIEAMGETYVKVGDTVVGGQTPLCKVRAPQKPEETADQENVEKKEGVAEGIKG
jgi:phosphatidylserine decarboxylase